MQLADERVQRGARTLRNDLHAPSVRQIADLAAQSEPPTGTGDEKAETDTLHAAADGRVKSLGARGFGLHLRGARPVRARRGAVRD